jgi:hypothetical protein
MTRHVHGQPLRYDGAIGFLALLIIALMLSVSPMALNAIGWNYDGLGAAGPTRFHPSSYLIVLLFLFIALRDGNPLTSAIAAVGHDVRLTLFVIIWAVVFYHGVKNQELPAAGLIDTFLMPVLMLMIFRRLGTVTRARIEMLMHGLLATNALLGLAEFLTGWRMTPYLAGGILITDDWRSTALLGHPLGNALMTGCYIMMLMMGGGGLLKGRMRYAILGLQFSAMIAFGGRASIVLVVLFAGVVLMIGIFRFLAGARLPLRTFAMIGVLLPVLILGLGGLYELGFFDKFILRFVEDKGSANARVVMFELFRGFTWTELMLGPPQVNLNYYVHVHRLEFGIESVWIAFSLYYGILPTVLFFTGLLFFLFAVMARCQKRGWLVIVYFFLVNTTFLGIAGKSINFTNLIMMLLVLLPAIRVQRDAPVSVNRQTNQAEPGFTPSVSGQFNRGWR